MNERHLDEAEARELPSAKVRLFHQTYKKRLSDIQREGLIPNSNPRHYGLLNDILDEHAPNEFKKAGLLRKNVIYAWYIAPAELGPTPEEMVTLRLNVDQSRVFVGDHHKSGVVLQGIPTIFTTVLSEQQRQLDLKLKGKDKRKIPIELYQKLFQDEADEVFSAFPERLKNDVSQLIQNTRARMREIGRECAQAYWSNIVTFDQFAKDYEQNEVGNWVSKSDSGVLYYPEAMIVGSVSPKDIEVVKKVKES